MYSVKTHLLPKAFGKYFSSDEYARAFFKETEFGQYSELQYNLGALNEFVEVYGEQIMQEWGKVEELYFATAPNSKILS